MNIPENILKTLNDEQKKRILSDRENPFHLLLCLLKT